jgi:Tfp pilus tip-associated adhesin PilY1
VFDSTLLPYGDLAASATESEKTVGETWSTPSVGRAGQPTSSFVAIVGSGRLPRSRERQPQRGGQRAGTRLYMLDMATGGVVDSRDVGADGAAEEQDDCAAESCAQLKNALHADPLGLGPPDGGTVTRVYQGDLDGHLWRFDLAPGPGPPGFAGSPRLLLDGGADQPVFGSVALLAGSAGRTYLFLGTGSDLLPRAGVTAGYRFLGLAEASTGITRQFESVLRTAGSGGVDESLAGAPSVAGSVVFFTTSSSRPGSNCEAPEVSLYALTIAGGVAYDANGDHRRDERDSPVVSRLRIGRATGPVVADRHVFVATGDRVQVFGDPDAFNGGAGFLGVRIVSWREIRHE